jgi:fatty acid desaturase
MLKVKSLKEEIRAAGLFERRESETWLKFGFLFTSISALFYAHTQLPFWASVMLLPVTSWFCATIAMMGHEGSHRGLSRNSFRNHLMFHLTFPVFGGVSAKYWHWKHDGQHHAYPNVADQDPDLLVWPMASTAIEHRRSTPVRQWFQRHMQGLFFWPLCMMLVWSMRGSAVAFLYRHARDKGMDLSWWADVLCLCLHVCCWIVVPYLAFGGWAIALYAGIWTLVGGALSAVFAPAHIGLPIVQEPKDIWRLQFETTRNLIMPKWLSFFFIGLDHQVEHHLFPQIPHQNLHEAARITRVWAQRHDVPYQQIPYLAGLADVTRFMSKAWNFEPDNIVDLRFNPKTDIEDSAA